MFCKHRILIKCQSHPRTDWRHQCFPKQDVFFLTLHFSRVPFLNPMICTKHISTFSAVNPRKKKIKKSGKKSKVKCSFTKQMLEGFNAHSAVWQSGSTTGKLRYAFVPKDASPRVYCIAYVNNLGQCYSRIIFFWRL